MNRTRLYETGGDKIFNIINHSILIISLLLVLYPIIFVLSASVSSPHAVMTGKVWLFPVDFSLDGYKAVFEEKDIWVGYGNSIYYTVFGTIISVIVTVMAAYPLSRKDFVGRNVIMFAFTFTMLFNGGMIPTFLVVRQLGLINTRWALLLPGAMAVWNVIITRTFFQNNIPDELLEASRIDGCKNISFILKIVLPLSGPVIAVISLFYAVNQWNEFFSALIYLQDSKLYPLQIILRRILIQNHDQGMIDSMEDQEMREFLNELLKYALIVVASIPVLVIYPFAQKYFVKGIMVGALKG